MDINSEDLYQNEPSDWPIRRPGEIWAWAESFQDARVSAKWFCSIQYELFETITFLAFGVQTEKE